MSPQQNEIFCWKTDNLGGKVAEVYRIARGYITGPIYISSSEGSLVYLDSLLTVLYSVHTYTQLQNVAVTKSKKLKR
jgi:hypothetical protein